jgi:hypothetical protein
VSSSAAHTTAQIDRALDLFRAVGVSLGLVLPGAASPAAI